MSLCTAMLRVPASRGLASRSLSSQCIESVEKLRQVLEEYRVQNYSREIPSRFRKEIVQAARSDSSIIAPEGLHRVLDNIGASHRLSKHDTQIIFTELGETPDSISAQRFSQLI